MTATIQMDKVYVHSSDVLEKEIEGLLIIIPLKGGIPDKDKHLALNDAGRAIWDTLDGKKTLKEGLAALAEEFLAVPGEIEKDVLCLVEELLKREMLIESSDACV
ncbi:MAG: PqqD family protein [Deltaproteobacteria bacterium]|nr:PqqD family protein [Deltaproteobacteria bacterium]